MKITETMDMNKAIRVGKFTICPMIDYPDGSKSVWIQEESGEGAQFPASALEQVIQDFYNRNF